MLCDLINYKQKKEGGNIKQIPAFKPIPNDNATPESSPEKSSPSRQHMVQQLNDIIKHPKKKTVKTNSISSNASIASPSSVHSNSNNGMQSLKFDIIANKIKTEMSAEENFTKSNPSPVNIESIDKCVNDSNNKKKKKSIASSASASPQTIRPLSPTPNVTSNVETKSPNPSLFASIFSSLNSSTTDKVVDSHKSNVEIVSQNVNPIKRTKSETGIERKKLKKSFFLEYEIVL